MENYPQSVDACVHVWLHSAVIISVSVFDGSLHIEHMDVYTCMYLVSSVCPDTVCVCVCRGVRAFAIYFSEWVAKQSYASCVSVRPLSVCWLGLHVCAGAS